MFEEAAQALPHGGVSACFQRLPEIARRPGLGDRQPVEGDCRRIDEAHQESCAKGRDRLEERRFRARLGHFDRRCHLAAALAYEIVENVPLVGEMLVEGALGGICQPRDLERRCLCVTLGQERFARRRENSLPPRLDGVGIGPGAGCLPAGLFWYR